MNIAILQIITCSLLLVGCSTPAKVLTTDPRYERMSKCGANIAAMIYATETLKYRIELNIRTGELNREQQTTVTKRANEHPSTTYMRIVTIDTGMAGIEEMVKKWGSENADMLAAARVRRSSDRILVLQDIIPQIEEQAISSCRDAGYAFLHLKSGIEPNLTRSSKQNAPALEVEAHRTHDLVVTSSPQVNRSELTNESPLRALQSAPPMPLTLGNNETLLKDISAMRNEQLIKGNFESNAEYEQRRQRYFDQFRNNKGYRITLDIENPQNKKEKIVYFNPDTEELRIAMPTISRDLIFLGTVGQNNLRWIHHSFVQIHTTDHKLRTYKASNRLGASIDVVETAVTSYGLAILSQATKDYSKDLRQIFSTRTNKNQARELLENGKIILDVIFDPQYPSTSGNPFLLKNEDKHKPTFDMPIDITNTRYAVPVRLLKISLLSKDGVELFSARGQQVNVQAITD